MEKPRKLPDQPARPYEIKDPKLPVIRGTAPHNRSEDHLRSCPVEKIMIQ
ncbi:MAG: hypothetical protein IKM59_00575 [Oscillospiraceae bacterium]|nr:hypothetical protein [Oscillospiraceae bacterium]